MNYTQADITLPPDPSVPGLWWMRNEGAWRAWWWRPDPLFAPDVWSTGQAGILPEIAHGAGWTCHSVATPLGDGQDTPP